jgi:cell division protein FtsB
MFKKKDKSRNLGRYSFRLMAGVVLLVVFVMGSALVRELYREYEIKKEIEQLKTQIGSMQKDNYELSQFIDYYQTDQYKEAEARRRLNLKADGEKVVMIDGSSTEAASTVTTPEETTAAKDNTPSYRRWWNYFFASK